MTEGNTKVSVIVPVYNVEQYLEKFLSTLLGQTLEELEFIFIDDKTPDKSIEIIESAANSDPRIRILYNEENMGPGMSRNRAIDVAKGEYFSFVDPDDYMDLNYYEVLYNLAKEKDADIVKAHVTAVNKNGEKAKGWTDGSKFLEDGIAIEEPLFACNRMEQFSQMFKREFLMKDPKLRFADTRIGEDSVFLLRASLNNPSIYTCKDTEYYHLIREDSLEGNVTFESCLEGVKAFEKRIEVFEDFSYPEGTTDYLKSVVNFYFGRFRKADSKVEDSNLRMSQRKLFKETFFLYI